MEYNTLILKANAYKQVLENTSSYRKEWSSYIKPTIQNMLNELKEKTGLQGEIKINDKIENLESIVFDLGRSSSGISENVQDSGIKRTMVKSNGALVYQQLFNGKVIVMIASPYIEGYGEPKPPMTLEILRPEEFKPPYIVRHLEILLTEITDWEDYDDDQPNKKPIGFQPIGFNNETLESPVP